MHAEEANVYAVEVLEREQRLRPIRKRVRPVGRIAKLLFHHRLNLNELVGRRDHSYEHFTCFAVRFDPQEIVDPVLDMRTQLGARQSLGHELVLFALFAFRLVAALTDKTFLIDRVQMQHTDLVELTTAVLALVERLQV